MDGINEKSYIFVYPDPIVDIEMISGAMFLYFDKPIAISLPPLVVIKDSYELLNLISERKPKWASIFADVFNAWQFQQNLCDNVFNILEPLKNEHYVKTWSIYPANKEALKKSSELIAAAHQTVNSLKHMINPVSSSGELARHILLEAFLEHGSNISYLYDYCKNLFSDEPLDDLLVKCYLLRLHFLSAMPKDTSILLTNQPIWSSLFPNKTNGEHERSIRNIGIDRDVVSWEIFKNIISPRLDPMNNDKVEFICGLLKSHKDEIEKLRLKCFSLADKIKNDIKLEELPSKVTELIRSEVERDVMELLQLDKRALDDFLSLVFSDEKTWIGLATFIGGIISGNTAITTGSAIASLSFIGSKSAQAITARNERLRNSDLGLVYRLSKKYP